MGLNVWGLHIGTEIHYPVPCHLQKAYMDLNHSKGDYPVTEQAAEEILSLPVYPELYDPEVSYIIEKINSFEI